MSVSPKYAARCQSCGYMTRQRPLAMSAVMEWLVHVDGDDACALSARGPQIITFPLEDD